MKFKVYFLFLLILACPIFSLGETDSSLVRHKGVFVDLGYGIIVPTDGSNVFPRGGNISAGYTFDKNLSIQVEWNQFHANTPDDQFQISNFRILPEVKLSTGAPGLMPYGLAGGGVDIYDLHSRIYSNTTPDSTNMYPDFLIGAGMQLSLGNAFTLFLETKLNFVLAYNSLVFEVPFAGGVHIDL